MVVLKGFLIFKILFVSSIVENLFDLISNDFKKIII